MCSVLYCTYMRKLYLRTQSAHLRELKTLAGNRTQSPVLLFSSSDIIASKANSYRSTDSMYVLVVGLLVVVATTSSRDTVSNPFLHQATGRPLDIMLNEVLIESNKHHNTLTERYQYRVTQGQQLVEWAVDYQSRRLLGKSHLYPCFYLPSSPGSWWFRKYGNAAMITLVICRALPDSRAGGSALSLRISYHSC